MTPGIDIPSELPGPTTSQGRPSRVGHHYLVNLDLERGLTSGGVGCCTSSRPAFMNVTLGNEELLAAVVDVSLFSRCWWTGLRTALPHTLALCNPSVSPDFSGGGAGQGY